MATLLRVLSLTVLPADRSRLQKAGSLDPIQVPYLLTNQAFTYSYRLLGYINRAWADHLWLDFDRLISPIINVTQGHDGSF